ncbi:MAG: putative molybdenum carrier protein [bacterium]|nr:putative molybdenum carrier protein [bacterium]MBU1918134.1 putative molybdenum carrier protein [bacterium]
MLHNNLIIISGGQTGADRAALDFAIEYGFLHAGWCPKSRLAEDGPLEEIYKLNETPSKRYEQRTEWNVKDSDGTVIFNLTKILTGGTLFTKLCAERKNKPYLVLSKETCQEPAQDLLAFIKEHKIQKINIAGPRGSKEPTIYDFVYNVLKMSLLS